MLKKILKVLVFIALGVFILIAFMGLAFIGGTARCDPGEPVETRTVITHE